MSLKGTPYYDMALDAGASKGDEAEQMAQMIQADHWESQFEEGASQMITCPSCQSTNVVSSSKGSRFLSDGEVDDNIEQIYICLCCLEEVPPPDFDEHEPELDYKKLHSTDDLPF